MRNLLLVLALLVPALGPSSVALSAQQAPGEIVHITGDLYEGRGTNHNTVFLITPEGVIMADPIGVDFSRWLKVELAARFGATVKYVLYTHHHPDHIAGGVVFADTATFVGHEGVTTALNAPLPKQCGHIRPKRGRQTR